MTTIRIWMTSDDIDHQERDMREVRCYVSPATLTGLDKGILLLICDSTVSSICIAHNSNVLHIVLLQASTFRNKSFATVTVLGSQLHLVESVNFLYNFSFLIGFP